jgi:hypothetical protein
MTIPRISFFYYFRLAKFKDSREQVVSLSLRFPFPPNVLACGSCAAPGEIAHIFYHLLDTLQDSKLAHKETVLSLVS